MSVLAFSVVSIALLWGLLSVQSWLPFANDTPNMPAAQGFNTAVSFVTNTNWQSYSGESALGLHGAGDRPDGAELPVRGGRAWPWWRR